MNFLTNILHILGTGASAYILSRSIRDPQTRPDVLANFYVSEANSVPFLEALKERAMREGDQWLSEQLACHAADERKHSRIFAHALKQLGKEPINIENLPPKKRVNPLFAAYFNGYPREALIPENIDWTVYAGSTYILELDSAKDYARMAQVLPENNPQERKLQIGLLSVAQDEARHATYLYKMLTRRFCLKEVESIIEQWRTRKVQAMWSLAGDVIQSSKIFS